MGILALLVSLSASAIAASNFCVTAIPQSPKASDLALGTAKDFFTWQLVISQATGPVTRGQIAERIPLSMLYEWQAIDVLNRKSSGSKRAAFAGYWGVIRDASPAGLAFAAARTKDPRAQIGLAILAGVLALAGGRAVAKVPNPAATQKRLLPDVGVPGDWDGIVVTGIVRGAIKIGPICQMEGTQ